MRLTGTRPFLSINEFGEIELPNFTLIIGPNGSGKSHLLQAIEVGAVQSSVVIAIGHMMNTPVQGIRLLRNDDPAPEGLTVGLKTEPNQLFQPAGPLDPFTAERVPILSKVRQKLLEPVQEQLEEALGGSLFDLAESAEMALQLPLADMVAAAAHKGFPCDEEKVAGVFRQVDKGAETAALDFGGSHLIHRARDFANRSNRPVIALSDEEFARAGSWGAYGLFDTHFVQVFQRYRDKKLLNSFWRITGGEKGHHALSDEAFEELWGGPPWERVSDALATFGLPYRVKQPLMDPSEYVYFQLERNDGVPVEFANLSSGEKVLIRFALSAFQVDETRLTVDVPKLLLLDEVDASLHPRNVHRLLSAIQSGLVESMGIPVIMSTHSPTTVALAPEGAMFEMTEEDRVPRPLTKQQALNRLTVGLPTLSIDYSGRRQIFVESSVDAAHYDRLASVLKDSLDLPRTLTFISAGGTDGGDSRGGCTIVTRIVTGLANNGVQSLFGLVDWDGKNNPAGRIKVLACGTHYTKENLLLDPLLVSILLLLDKPDKVVFPVTIPDLQRAGEDDLQRLANVVTEKLELSGADSENRYLNGLALAVPKAYQVMKGHELEDRLKAAFPSLNRYSGSGKWLADPIINRVLSDFPWLCPKPLADAFIDLATDL